MNFIKIIFCFCGIILCATANAQEMPKVVFKNGKFLQDIPYERRFKIKTSTLVNGKKTNICSVKIWPEEGDVGATDTLYAYDWTSPDASEFELVISSPFLKYKKVYLFEFRFYTEGKFSPGNDLYQKILYRSKRVFETIGLLTGYEIDTIIDNINKELVNDDSYTKLRVSRSGKLEKKSDPVNLIKLPWLSPKGYIISDDFAALVQANFDLEAQRNVNQANLIFLRRQRKDLLSFLKILKDSIPNQLQLIDNLATSLQKETHALVSRSDIAPLRLILKKSKYCNKSCLEKFELVDKIILALERNDRLTTEKKSEVAFLEARVGTIKEIVFQGIQLSEIINTQDVIEIRDSSKLKSINIGTAFGGSFALLNTFSDAGPGEASSFGYFALKFHLGPVDRSIPDPYLARNKFLGRTSFFIGVKALGNLDYRGIGLTKVLGTNPVVGFSYDLDPGLSLDVGTVLFRQPSNSLLISRESSIKSALTIGLSFDPNLINRLSNVFSNNKKW